MHVQMYLYMYIYHVAYHVRAHCQLRQKIKLSRLTGEQINNIMMPGGLCMHMREYHDYNEMGIFSDNQLLHTG